MSEMIGWIASAATMIAAMMTAANLGARFTGWGFVVFLGGSLAWSANALLTGQHSLLWTNGFLTLVNIVGIWRWLGRQARYEDGAEAARQDSEDRASPALFPVALLQDGALSGPDGATLGKGVGAMATCEEGRIAYVVVRETGVGDRLHALCWEDLCMTETGMATTMDARHLAALPAIDPEHWPDRAPR